MQGIIFEHGSEYCLNMKQIVAPIKEYLEGSNWLITGHEFYFRDGIGKVFGKDDPVKHEYLFVSGDEVIDTISNNDITFVWGVFSAFPQDTTLTEILKYPLPYADGYRGFWKNPITLQHPLATTEIVPWDATLMLIISKENGIIQKIKSKFPKAKSLEEYNLD